MDTLLLPKTINLLPESKLTNLNFKKKQPLLLVSAFLLSLTPLPTLLTNYQEAESLLIDVSNLKVEQKVYRNDLDGMESKSDTLSFLQYFTKEVYSRNEAYQEHGRSLWKLRVLLNHLQNSLEYEDITDTWFDEFKITSSSQDRQRPVVPRPRGTASKESIPVLKLSGRYLVRPTVDTSSDKSALKENLIELNQKKAKGIDESSRRTSNHC